MRIPNLLLPLLVCVLANVASAQQVGDKIVVITDAAQLRANCDARGNVPQGEILKVRHVNGDWFWVRYSDGKTGIARGWINRSDVLPLAQALDHFSDELKRNPAAKTYVIRGRIRGYMRDYDKALADFSEAVQLDPKFEDAYRDRANAWAGKGDFDRAIVDCSEAIRLHSNLDDAYADRANLWFAKHEFDRGITDCNQAIHLNPKSSRAYRTRAVGWECKKQFSKALADLDQAIRIEPASARAFSVRATMWMQRGEIEKATADFNEAIRLDPDYATPHNNRASLAVLQGDWKKAIADVTEAIQLDPADAAGYCNRGQFFLEAGDIDQAISDLDEAIRRNPKSANAYCARGIAWMNKEEYDKAFVDLTQAILDPKHRARALYGRGLVWKKKGQFAKAIADYKESLQVKPPHNNAYWGLAWLLATCPDAKYRDGQEAVEYAEKAQQLLGLDNAIYAGVVAAAYAEAGDFDSAAIWQRDACKRISRTASPFFAFGEFCQPDSRLNAELQSRLELYKARKPYREVSTK